MIFTYPQILPTWQFMPFIQPPLSMNLFQLQMQRMAAIQYNATLPQPGHGTFVIPHALQSISQLDQNHALSTGLHQDRTHESERGRHKTAASTSYHIIHAPFSMITNNHHTIVSHHSRVGDFNSARSGLAERPPSSGMSATPNHRSRSRTVIQNRSKRASAIRGQRRKRDDLLQYVVAAEGTESGRPWKRRRRGGQPMASIPVPVPSMSLSGAASTPTSNENNEVTESTNTPEQQDIPMDQSDDVEVQGKLVEMEE